MSNPATLDETFAAAKAARETYNSDKDTIYQAYTTLNKQMCKDEQRVREERDALEKAHNLLMAAAKKRFKAAIANVAGVDPEVAAEFDDPYNPY